jgi:hypothetical protein
MVSIVSYVVWEGFLMFCLVRVGKPSRWCYWRNRLVAARYRLGNGESAGQTLQVTTLSSVTHMREIIVSERRELISVRGDICSDEHISRLPLFTYRAEFRTFSVTRNLKALTCGKGLKSSVARR